jgi:hypothetical protein
MLVAVNTLYRYAEDSNRIERVVWISPTRTACFVINIHNNEYPTIRQIEDIEEGVREGTYIIEETDPWMRIIDLETLSDKEKKRWNEINEIVKMIASSECEPNIFIPKERGKMVRKAAETFTVDVSTISRYLKRYWKRGKTMFCLLFDYDRCGGSGQDRIARQNKKLGRKRKYATIHAEMVMTEDIKRLFRISLDKFYYSANRPTLRRAYEQMIAEYFTIENKIDNRQSIPIVQEGSAIPSFGQMRYWFNKWRMRDIKKEVITREGYRKYNQNYKPVLGSTQQDVDAPGSVYQIDATTADVTVVSAFDRTKILGRCTFYLVICGYSHLITGLYVGLEAPSWTGAMLSLINACEKKVEYCKQNGVDITEDEWPSKGLPQFLLADRAELLSKKALSMIEHLHIGVKNTPPYSPQWKPLVERFFGMIQQHAIPFMPGAVYKDANDRGVRDNRVNASLTIAEVTRILIKCAIHFNNHHYISGYVRTAHQIAENVSPIPIQLWNYGIKYKSGRLREVSQDILRFNMLPSEKASVSAKGIKWNGMLYSCDTAIKQRWFVIARTKGSFKCDISFDARNVNQIYLRLGRNEYDVCYLLDSQARYKDKTIEDVRYLLEVEQQEQVTSGEKELGERISLAAEIEAIVKEAVEKTTKAESKPQSKAKKLRDIRDNRQEEKERSREQESIVLEGLKRADSASSVMLYEDEDENVELPNHLALLKKIQQEGLNGNH